MGLESQIKLGRCNELAAIENVQECASRYEQLIDQTFSWSHALHARAVFEVADVIDPVET